MAKWAIGVRLPNSTEKLVEQVINKGEVLRTHLLRPTWHFVSPEDINWLLELTAPHIKASQKARDRDLELTETIYLRSNSIIEKALSEHGALTREKLVAELNKAGIATDQNRAAHLLMRAELEKIICSGPIEKSKPTYALFAERVPKPKKLVKEAAQAELARRYFTSRSPATLQDFTWWSGLSAKDASQALELVKPKFIPEVIDDRTYWLVPDFERHAPDRPTVHLLPTYDEFILSYYNRSASIPAELEKHMKEISDRGVFWPIILFDGQVIGIWKRIHKKDTVIVEVELFSSPESSVLELIEKAAAKFADFLGLKLEFNPNPTST